MTTGNESRNSLWNDASLGILVLTNLITIFIAIKEGWNATPLLWIYCFQGIVIGFFNFVRILQLKKFSTKDILINGHHVEPTFSTKLQTAFVFLIAYGAFHWAYFTVVQQNYPQTLSNSDLQFIYLSALLFFINHLFSYIYNRPRDTEKQSICILMFYPLIRIIPMYLIFVFVNISSLIGLLPLFLLLKTLADALMHIIEHQVIRKGEA